MWQVCEKTWVGKRCGICVGVDGKVSFCTHAKLQQHHSLCTVIMFEEMAFSFWYRNTVVAARLLNSKLNGNANVDSLLFATALGVHRGRLDMHGLPVRTLML